VAHVVGIQVIEQQMPPVIQQKGTTQRKYKIIPELVAVYEYNGLEITGQTHEKMFDEPHTCRVLR
jgi:hypothetical protein